MGIIMVYEELALPENYKNAVKIDFINYTNCKSSIIQNNKNNDNILTTIKDIINSIDYRAENLTTINFDLDLDDVLTTKTKKNTDTLISHYNKRAHVLNFRTK